MPLKKHILIYLLFPLTVLLLGLPGIIGFIAKHYIERAVELNNLNTALHIEISDYQQFWFSSEFTLQAFIEDEYEEELIPVGSFPSKLKHGPITLVNHQPGFGAFYLYNEGFSSTKLPGYVGYARAGFFGNVELSINIDIEQLPETPFAQIAKQNDLTLSPLIMSVESDIGFEQIDYQVYWPGVSANSDTQNSNASNSTTTDSIIRDIRLAGHLQRLDDEHWQGTSVAKVNQLSLPSNNIELENFEFQITNSVNIAESDNRTYITTSGQADTIKTQWHEWDSAELQIDINNADLSALSSLYDLAQRVYLEFDSPFDEYAQLEYMAALQTLIPALLSDNAEIKLKELTFIDHQSQLNKTLTGVIHFPDLPEYMDDHLISLMSKTSGKIEVRTEHLTKVKEIVIENGRISIDDQPLDLSVFN